jgi:hypothetical protein
MKLGPPVDQGFRAGGQIIQHMNFPTAVNQLINDMRTDEPGTASYHDFILRHIFRMISAGLIPAQRFVLARSAESKNAPRYYVIYQNFAVHMRTCHTFFGTGWPCQSTFIDKWFLIGAALRLPA